MKKELKEFNAVSSLDGISVTFWNGDKVLIPHDEFRTWSFAAGYWEGAYYEFTLDLPHRAVAKFFKENKNYHAIAYR